MPEGTPRKPRFVHRLCWSLHFSSPASKQTLVPYDMWMQVAQVNWKSVSPQSGIKQGKPCTVLNWQQAFWKCMGVSHYTVSSLWILGDDLANSQAGMLPSVLYKAVTTIGTVVLHLFTVKRSRYPYPKNAIPQWHKVTAAVRTPKCHLIQ